MSWEYFMVPCPKNAVFPAEALEEMRNFWDAYPTYRRTDGVIAICRDAEYRDWVLASGTKDQPDANVEVVAIQPNRVTIGVNGAQDKLDAFFRFILFCKSRWPCELLDQREYAITPEAFLSEMKGTYHPPSMVDD